MNALTGPADLRRQRRLGELVDRLGRGIDAAREIWGNWFEGECFGQDHPGQGPGDYIASLGLRLSLTEAMAAMPNGSTREVAAVAGVSNWKVATERSGVRNLTPDLPATVRGADGKQYPARVIREVTAQIIEPAEEDALDLDVIAPSAVAESTAVWLADLKRYVAGITNVPPPPQTDPAVYKRLRRRLVAALCETIDNLARDE